MSRSFDAIDDVINCGSATILDDLGPLTIAAWINPLSAGEGNFGCVCMKGDHTDSSGSKYYMAFDGAVGQTRLLFWITKTSPGDQLQRTSNSNVATGVWTFASTTWDGSNDFNNIHIYYNLSEVTYLSGTNATSIPSDSSLSLGIGNDTGTGIQTFDGSIAYVQLWNRVLSVNEMAQAMRFPGSITKGLVGFWPLLGVSPEGDYSGNKNSGTVTGALVGTTNPPINRMFGAKRSRLWYSSFSTTVAAGIANTKLSVLPATKLSVLNSTKLTLVSG